MIQFFFKSPPRRNAVPATNRNPAWHCDPLAHPVLDRMTPSELGDLPMGNARCDRDCGC